MKTGRWMKRRQVTSIWPWNDSWQQSREKGVSLKKKKSLTATSWLAHRGHGKIWMVEVKSEGRRPQSAASEKGKRKRGFCFAFMIMSKVPSIYRTRKHVMEMLCKKEGHIWSKHAMILRGDLFSLSSIRTICQSIDFLDTVSDCT